MAKYWDLVVNSGRFKKTLPVLMTSVDPKNSAFWSFMQFSDAMWQTTGKTYALTPEELVDGIFHFLTQVRLLSVEHVRPLLLEDYLASGARAPPQCLAQEKLLLGGRDQDSLGRSVELNHASKLKHRQTRHAQT
jgi:hypothetical protein